MSPSGAKRFHQLSPPGDDGDRHPVGDRLPHRRQIGRDAEQLLRAAGREPEPGDDLVEDQHDPVSVTELPTALEEARLGEDHAGVDEDRLDDQRGDDLFERFE